MVAYGDEWAVLQCEKLFVSSHPIVDILVFQPLCGSLRATVALDCGIALLDFVHFEQMEQPAGAGVPLLPSEQGAQGF